MHPSAQQQAHDDILGEHGVEGLLRAIFGNEHEEELYNMDKKTYSRIPFDVEAVQVTDENLTEVSEWSGATVVPEQKSIGTGPHLRVLVYEGRGEKYFRAFPGDWVVKSESHGGFKVFNDRSFRNTFAEK